MASRVAGVDLVEQDFNLKFGSVQVVQTFEFDGVLEAISKFDCR